MNRFVLSLGTLGGWGVIVFWLLGGCASSPQRLNPSQVQAIEERITDRLFSAMHDRMECEFVDRVESAGPGEPEWAVFEGGHEIALEALPELVRDSIKEGRAICVEQVPEIADLWEPAQLFDCIESGQDLDACMSEG